MNVYQYEIAGDPEALLAAWQKATARIDKEEYFLHVVTTSATGLKVLDVCPTEADFQGWINGDDWRRIKAELGGDVVVTPLGEIRAAVARDTVVEVVRPHAHSH